MIYKLLFVIILASSVLAQDTTPNLIERDSSGTLTAPVNVDTNLYFITIDWFEPLYSEAIYELLELYKGYETECWNDSTKKVIPWPYNGTWTYVDNEKHNGTGSEFFTPFPDKWLHKKPTFSGFMQYLKIKE